MKNEKTQPTEKNEQPTEKLVCSVILAKRYPAI